MATFDLQTQGLHTEKILLFTIYRQLNSLLNLPFADS